MDIKIKKEECIIEETLVLNIKEELAITGCEGLGHFPSSQYKEENRDAHYPIDIKKEKEVTIDCTIPDDLNNIHGQQLVIDEEKRGNQLMVIKSEHTLKSFNAECLIDVNLDEDGTLIKKEVEVSSKGSPQTKPSEYHQTETQHVEHSKASSPPADEAPQIQLGTCTQQTDFNYSGCNTTRYNCEICSRGFVRKSIFESHIRIHTKEKPYTCEICNRQFAQKGNLAVHTRLHTNDKPYKCEICSRQFAQKSNLTVHTKTHANEKPHMCMICNRKFTLKCTLTRHIRVHTKEKPYTCKICNLSFAIKTTLDQHIRIHTKEKPYKCDICSKQFSHRRILGEHIRIHTKEKPFKCEICSRKFSQKNHLVRHIRVHTNTIKMRDLKPTIHAE